MTLSKNDILSLPPLYGIANVESLRDPLEFVKNLIVAGVSLIQLRSKQLAPAEYADLALRIVAARDALHAAGRGFARIIINDAVTVCILARADGVHLGQDDMSPIAAREVLGQERILGLSTHCAAQIRVAPAQVLDYIAFGPVFSSPTKQGHAPETGTNALAGAVTLATRPLVAIGGITSENVREVFTAGAACAAVISDLERAADLPMLVERYKQVKSDCAPK